MEMYHNHKGADGGDGDIIKIKWTKKDSHEDMYQKPNENDKKGEHGTVNI